MARFHHLRTDKSPSECTTDQLGQKKIAEYASKRDFAKTSEPTGGTKAEGGPIFVIQEHHSRRLHYDFRLEKDGVLKSWAVPKGVPASSRERHLAVETEDHPLGYANFAGTIPEGEYGAGTVKIWDHGTYVTKFWEQDKIEVTLNGQQLHGRYVLVRLKKAQSPKDWLMLKGKE
jgi:bifunctional non-homologous end joining protein LigD